MTTKLYALERGGPKRLQLRWRWGWRDFEVALDGETWKLDRAAVLAGASLTFPGGSTLFVRRVPRKWWSVALRDELQVDLDGAPVPGSDGHPRTIGARAGNVIALFGILHVLFIGLWIAFQGGRRDGPFTLASGAALLSGPLLLVLAVLAWLGVRHAVVVAAGQLALEFVLMLALSGGRFSPTGLVIQVLVVVHLFGAWKRMGPLSTKSLGAVFE